MQPMLLSDRVDSPPKGLEFALSPHRDCMFFGNVWQLAIIRLGGC